MNDTISPQEAAELRARLDLVSQPAPRLGLPLDHPLPPEGTWERQQMDAQERKRQERLEAARLAHESAQAEEAAKTARRVAIDQEIAKLEARRAPIEDEFERAEAPLRATYWSALKPIKDDFDRLVAPIEAELDRLRSKRKATEP